MRSHILILSGSPRKNGNTERLVTSFADGAIAAGKTVRSIRVADLKIGGCHGCEHCFSHGGVCVQTDDMPPILDGLRKADALVLTSPVYYFGVTAQLKPVIDRFSPCFRKAWP
jgi:multimeric flavodoxin WrbA